MGSIVLLAVLLCSGCGDSGNKIEIPDNPIPAKGREARIKQQMEYSNNDDSADQAKKSKK